MKQPVKYYVLGTIVSSYSLHFDVEKVGLGVENTVYFDITFGESMC